MVTATPKSDMLHFLLIGSIIGNYCIYCPILIYFLQKFYKLKRTLLYQKRFGKVVCVSNIVALIILLLTRPLQMVSTAITMSESAHQILRITNDILYSYIYTLFIYLIIWRCYLLFFRLNWKKSSLNSQWKQHLNSQSGRTSQTTNAGVQTLDFFLRNKQTYKRTSAIFFIIIYFIHSTVICLAYIYTKETNINMVGVFTHRTLSFLIEIVMWLPPFIVAVILWKATPQFYDYFFIRNEMKWLCVMYAIDIICSFLVYTAQTEFIQETIIVYIRSLTLLMMVLTTTFYVWFKNETEIISDTDAGVANKGGSLRNLSYDQPLKKNIIIRMLSLVAHRNQRSLSAINRERGQTQVIDLISNIDSFEIFMQHLNNEYSMENLLAIVEFIQFKLQLLMDINFMKNIPNFEQENEKCIDNFIKTTKKDGMFHLFNKQQENKNNNEYDSEEDVEYILENAPAIFLEPLARYGMKTCKNDESSAISPTPDEDDIDSKPLIKTFDIDIIGTDDETLDIYNTLKSSLTVCHRKYCKNTYHLCFIARDAVSYMVDMNLVSNIEKAVEMGQKLLDKRLIKYVLSEACVFENKYLLYQFSDNNNLESETETETENNLITLELEVADKLYDLLDICDRKWHLRKYKQCFIAKEAIQVMINAELAVDIDDAIKLGNCLMKKKIIEHVERKHKTFDNQYFFYRFIHSKFVDNKVINSINTMDEEITRTKTSEISNIGHDIDIDIIDESKIEDTQKKIMYEKLRRNAYTKLKPNLDIRTRKYHLKKYMNCFIGSEAIPIIIDLSIAQTEKEAITFCNQLISMKIIEHVEQDHSFINGNYFYRFISDKIDYIDQSITERSHNSSQEISKKNSYFEEDEMNELQEKGRKLKDFLEIRDRKWHLKKYKKCFVGTQCVQIIIKLQYAQTIREAIKIGNKLIDANIIRHVTNEHRFENKYYFYNFVIDLEYINNDQDNDNEIIKRETTTDYSTLLLKPLSIKRISNTFNKPKHFLTLGYNKYTKYMYNKYFLLELPPTIPKSSIVFGNDQFKYQLNHHFSLNIKNNNNLNIKNNNNSYEASSEIPSISEILHRQQRELLVTNKTKFDYIQIIKLLYDKYISHQSDLQVNLSYSTRGRLRYLIIQNDINELLYNEIFILFDQAVKELLRLLSDSLSRFKNTKEFVKVNLINTPVVSNSIHDESRKSANTLFSKIPLSTINSMTPMTSPISNITTPLPYNED